MHLFRSLSPTNAGVKLTTTKTPSVSSSSSSPSSTTQARPHLKPILLNNVSNSERNFHGEDTSSIFLTATPTSAPAAKKSVNFSTVEVRSYPITMGCNPAVSCGVPITIDWKYDEETIKTKSVTDMDPSFPHRSSESLRLSRLERSRILQKAGFTRMEMGERIYEMNQIRKRREQSIEEFMNETDNANNKNNILSIVASPFQKVWNGISLGGTGAGGGGNGRKGHQNDDDNDDDDDVFGFITNLVDKSSSISFHPSALQQRKKQAADDRKTRSNNTSSSTSASTKTHQVLPVR